MPRAVAVRLLAIVGGTFEIVYGQTPVMVLSTKLARRMRADL